MYMQMLSVKMLVTMPLLFALALFAEGSDVMPSSVSNLTALAALILVLIFIVTKLIPDMLRQQAAQSEVFAKAAQAQTDSSVKATADASSKATAAISEMHVNFVTTLDKMAVRYHDDTTTLSESIAALGKTCAVEHATGTGATIHKLRQQLGEEQ